MDQSYESEEFVPEDDMGDPGLRESLQGIGMYYENCVQRCERIPVSLPIIPGQLSHHIDQTAASSYITTLHALRYGVIQAIRSVATKIFDPAEQLRVTRHLEKVQTVVEEEIVWTEHHAGCEFDHKMIAEVAEEKDTIEVDLHISEDALKIWFGRFRAAAQGTALRYLGSNGAEERIH